MVGGVLAGAYPRAGTPAGAAWAASATPAFPAVGTTNARAPACPARVTAAARPRALKEPVGFVASSLTRRPGRPYRAASRGTARDRKSTRLNSSHGYISYAVFCL